MIDESEFELCAIKQYLENRDKSPSYYNHHCTGNIALLKYVILFQIYNYKL